jgi:UPF0755 protein
VSNKQQSNGRHSVQDTESSQKLDSLLRGNDGGEAISNLPPPAQQADKLLKKKKKTGWIIGLAIAAALLLISFFSVFAWYKLQLTPRTIAEIYHVVEVKQGASTKEIAEQLEEKQVIKSSSAFLWHIKFNRISGLQAGSYRVSSNFSTPDIVKILEGGEVNDVDVLITPGQRLSQIKQKLVNSGYSKAEVDQALDDVRDHSLLKGYPESKPLEGYLFPDTYKIGVSTSAEQFVRLMLDTFESKITPEIEAGIKKQGLTVQEGIILASIVQKEVSDYPNQQKVAQVFLKRLRDGNVLGSDVTFQYAAAETGQNATPELNSPYNTRIVSGLPPTAIANFNIDALRAVANPTNSSYNYFVAGDDGTVYYSKTEAEHESFTRQHCQSCFQ